MRDNFAVCTFPLKYKKIFTTRSKLCFNVKDKAVFLMSLSILCVSAQDEQFSSLFPSCFGVYIQKCQNTHLITCYFMNIFTTQSKEILHSHITLTITSLLINIQVTFLTVYMLVKHYHKCYAKHMT